jgi:teichuronic acid biosynthesis glycosyltransferase TuaC
MNVLVLSHLFPNEFDSVSGIFVREQVRALRALDVNVVVVSPSYWGPRWLRFFDSVRKRLVIPAVSEVDGFPVYRPRAPILPKNGGYFAWGVLFYLACRALISRLKRETKFDVIHAHTALPDGFAAVLLGRDLHLPVVCTVHGSDVNVYPYWSRPIRAATNWALRRIDRLIAVSEDLKTSTIALAGERQVAVIHNGADGENFRVENKATARSKLFLPQHKKVICFVGYLRSEKALNYLIEALAELPARDSILCVVGDGPLKTELMALAIHLGIGDRCIFAGQRPHEEVPLWLSAADCLVLCSVSEGLPTILPEAMLCGTPIIATSVGGIPEIIHDCESGLIVPIKNSTAIAEAINRLFSDPELAARITERARAVAIASLTWKVNARQTLAVYEDALQHATVSCSQGTRTHAPSPAHQR